MTLCTRRRPTRRIQCQCHYDSYESKVTVSHPCFGLAGTSYTLLQVVALLLVLGFVLGLPLRWGQVLWLNRADLLREAGSQRLSE